MLAMPMLMLSLLLSTVVVLPMPMLLLSLLRLGVMQLLLSWLSILTSSSEESSENLDATSTLGGWE